MFKKVNGDMCWLLYMADKVKSMKLPTYHELISGMCKKVNLDMCWLLYEVSKDFFDFVSLLLCGFLVFCLFVLVWRVALGRAFVGFMVLGLVFFNLLCFSSCFGSYPFFLTASCWGLYICVFCWVVLLCYLS